MRWLARITYQTRDELVARFGKEVGNAVPLDHKPDKEGADFDEQFAKAAIYEIWDLPSRTAIWISKSYNEATLDQKDDPLRLKDFFPCPRPAYGTLGPDSLMPVPDFLYYESQARDIDELTRRIGRLTEAAKLRGFYAARRRGQGQAQGLDGGGRRHPHADRGVGCLRRERRRQGADPVAPARYDRHDAPGADRGPQGADLRRLPAHRHRRHHARGRRSRRDGDGHQDQRATGARSGVRDKQKELARFIRDQLRSARRSSPRSSVRRRSPRSAR